MPTTIAREIPSSLPSLPTRPLIVPLCLANLASNVSQAAGRHGSPHLARLIGLIVALSR